MRYWSGVTVIVALKKIIRLFGKGKIWVILALFSFFGLRLLAQADFSTYLTGTIIEAKNSINEGSTYVTTITATGGTAPYTYTINNTEDYTKFTIDSSTGVLTINNAPDYENPSDCYEDNKYVVMIIVNAADGTNLKVRDTIFVLNVDESPDPPSHLYIVPDDKFNQLYWTASTAGGISEYRIYRSTDSITWETTPLTTVTGSLTSYTDNNLVNGKFYFYKVTAWDGANESVSSNIRGATPGVSQISRYMHFDGSGDCLVARDTNKMLAIPYNTDLTIECWVRFSEIPVSNTYIISRDYNKTVSRFFCLYYNASTGKIVYQYAIGTASLSSVFTPVVNKWYHIAITCSVSGTTKTYSMFVNGVLDNQVSTSTGDMETYTVSSTSVMAYYVDSRTVIGATTSGLSPITYGNYFTGDISEVRIWNTARTSTQISNNMYTRCNANDDKLIGLWHLDTMFTAYAGNPSQVYGYQKSRFNAVVNGSVSCEAPHVVAVDDTLSLLASSSKNINVRENDTLNLKYDAPATNVKTKIVWGPRADHGSAVVVLNNDSICYTPNCFIGKDTIKYLICDTTFFSNPYQYADTAILVVNTYDNVKPVLTLPSDVTVSCEADQTPSGTGTATATDNCDSSPAVTYSDASTQVSDVTDAGYYNYKITRTWKATDVAGNTTTGNQTITVQDVTTPVISCTANKTVSTDTDQDYYTHSSLLWDAGGSDNCSPLSYTYTLSGVTTGSGSSLDGVTFNKGMTTVSWTITDASNNKASCSFTVQVNDNQVPTVSCISDKSVDCDPDQCTYTHSGNTWDATGSDNIAGWVITYVLTGATTGNGSSLDGVIFNKGVTTVTWTNTDASANTISCSYIVTVNDAQNPAITAPSDVSVNADAGLHTASGVTLGAPVTSDNCGVTSVTNDAPALFPAGTTTVTWTVTDIHGNTNAATQTVTVTDNTAPVITSDSAVMVFENTIAVMTVTASDPDAGDKLRFSITGGADALEFTIDSISGALTFVTSPDYEVPTDADTDNIYEVAVIVRNYSGLIDIQTIDVKVMDANDPPTDIILSKSDVDENMPEGTSVGTLTSIDEDVSDNHMYTIGGDDVTFFSVSNDILITTAFFNYTTRQAYSIVITTTDGQGASFSKAFTITVNNINDPPVILNADNAPADTLIFDAVENETTRVCLTVTDPDNDSTTISVLQSVNGLGILLATGKNCFDYTPVNDFLGKEVLFVTVCDNGEPSMCDTVYVTMNVAPDFALSQVISPNGDGINDTWVISGLERFPENKVIIFNRWGDIVYKARGYDNVDIVWDGDYNNGKSSKGGVPAGTYFYIIELGNGSKLTGFIVLNR